jgi:hypothetical protein
MNDQCNFCTEQDTGIGLYRLTQMLVSFWWGMGFASFTEIFSHRNFSLFLVPQVASTWLDFRQRDVLESNGRA